MKKLIAAGAAGAAALAAVAVVAAPSSGASRSKTVLVKDNVFAPKTVTVKRGTTITFVWRGKAPHNVSARGPARFEIRSRIKGRVSKKLTKPGTYRIVCDLHAPTMKMAVKVVR